VRITGVVALLIGVVAALTSAGSGAAGPQGMLAFSCGGICLVSADGSGRTTVGNGPAADHAPVWSPDGRRLAFVSDRQGDEAIYLMDADGGNVSRLTPIGLQAIDPSWSRTNEIAFSGQSAAGDSGIYVIAADGSGLREVYSNGDPRVLSAQAPAISPDGSKIAFTGSQNATITNQHPTDGIYVIATDGTTPTRVATGDAPAWSYDSRRLAFTAPDSSNVPQLMVSNADGSGARAVTAVDWCTQKTRPAWSPDGAWLAYSACPGSSFAVDVVPSAGGTPTTVTYQADEPDWRPATPSTGLLLHMRFAQRACSSHPGRVSITVTDQQSRPLAGATVTFRGGTRIRPTSAQTNANGAATISLQPAHVHADGRLYLVATAQTRDRPTLTKKLSLPACA
jgi:Tol biopolymer transport system component